MRRCVFDSSFGPYLGVFPGTSNRSWLATVDAAAAFGYWQNALEARRDIFLGYCGAAVGIANNLKRYLERDLAMSVLDWRMDFAPAGSILERIATASDTCSAGIFLFTKDDALLDASNADSALPRDNVLFEAGYFISAKGKKRVLIVRESGTKMPADLGGDIYATLVDRSNLEPIERTVRAFVAAL